MSPNTVYKKELVLLLFLLLGVNSSWRWFGGNNEDANLAARKNQSGMIELATSRAEGGGGKPSVAPAVPPVSAEVAAKRAELKAKNCATGRLGCIIDTLWNYSDDQELAKQNEATSKVTGSVDLAASATTDVAAKIAAEAVKPATVAVAKPAEVNKSAAATTPATESTSVGEQAPAKSQDKVVAEPVKAQTAEPAAKVNSKSSTKLMKFKDGGPEYKVNFYPNEDENFTVATVTKSDTEGSVGCDVYCGRYSLEGVVNVSSADSLAAFSKQLIPVVNASAAKDAKTDKTRDTTEVTDESAADKKKASVSKVAAGSGKSKKDKDDDEDNEDEDEEDNQQTKVDTILEKCDSKISIDQNRVYLNCLVNRMNDFNKTVTDKELKKEVFEELYNEHVSDRLVKLLKSDDKKDTNKAKNIIISLQKLFPEKSASKIRNEMRSLVVKSETKKLETELAEDINGTAKKASSAYDDFKEALNNNDTRTAALRKRDYEVAMRQLLLLKLSTDSQNIRNDPAWSTISRLYDEDSYGEVDKLVRGIYSGADKYRDGLYDNLVRGRSIEELISNDPLQAGTNLFDSPAGIAGRSGVGFNDLRYARDSARGMFSGGGQYPGASPYAGRGNTQGVFRGGPQYSPMNPTLLNSRTVDNSPFYEWGSVRPDSYRGNNSYLSGGNNSYNSNFNRPMYTGNTVGSNYYPNSSQSWRPSNLSFSPGNQFSFQSNSNCRYSSLSPLSCNTGYDSSGGGRFGSSY